MRNGIIKTIKRNKLTQVVKKRAGEVQEAEKKQKELQGRADRHRSFDDRGSSFWDSPRPFTRQREKGFGFGSPSDFFAGIPGFEGFGEESFELEEEMPPEQAPSGKPKDEIPAIEKEEKVPDIGGCLKYIKKFYRIF